MSDLNNIVQVTISRETQAVAQSSFGTLAILSEFSTSKTLETFVRHRYYTSLTEMVADGWLTYDAEYKAAQIAFSQNPKPERIMIGRKDSGDTDWAAALGAIQIAVQDWYAFMIIGTKSALITFSADFITGNTIDFVINGVTVPQVTYATSHANTMSLIETAIEGAISGSTVTVSAVNRTVLIAITDKTPSSITVALAGGASQPTATIGYDDIGLEAKFKLAAAWAETQKKIYFVSSADAVLLTSGTTDIAYFMKSQNYDRTVVFYHTSDQTKQTPAWAEVGFPSEALPYDPGSQTWAYKTIAGVASYYLTSAQRGYALGKNANIYTETAGVDITEEGRVASGEYIDIIRGLDWLESRIQEEIFSQLVNVRKIPYTDEGVTLIAGILSGVLAEGAREGLLVADSIEVEVPAVADISATDKANRLLPDIEFTATLQGAIHKVEIAGVVTL